MSTVNARVILGLFFAAAIARCVAAPFAYDSFEGLPSGTFAGGASPSSWGWTDAWSPNFDPAIEVLSPDVQLAYQVPGAGTVVGGPTLLSFTAATGSRSIQRHFPPRDIGFYIAMLVRIPVRGTGGGEISLDFLIEDGSKRSGFKITSIAEGSFPGWLRTGNSGKGLQNGDSTNSYWIVAKVFESVWAANPKSNPTSTTDFSTSYGGTPGGRVSGIEISCGRTTTSGESSAFYLDSLLLGDLYADVLPSPSDAQLAPGVSIRMIPEVKWYATSGKTYHVQKSFDLSAWTTVSEAIRGNNSDKTWIDTSVSSSSGFYRVFHN
jgi:hypothetical protein